MRGVDSLDFVVYSPCMSFKIALKWLLFWWILALVFNLGIFYFSGASQALAFLTGYIVEQSLSVDNLFVMITIFAFFKVPHHAHQRVLFWGIWGAVFMRALFVFAGIGVLHRFHWVFYLLGAFLIVTGVKSVLDTPREIPVGEGYFLKWIQRRLPLTSEFHGGAFFVRKGTQWWGTPLFLTLVVIEFTDLVFAMDSIPAILGITTDSFIVITSNLFAVLSLRSLYFVISHALTKVRFLHYGLGAILIFVGVKMIADDFYAIPLMASLSIILGILLATFLLSFKFNKK